MASSVKLRPASEEISKRKEELLRKAKKKERLTMLAVSKDGLDGANRVVSGKTGGVD
jgi:hypothetical protein